jgi:pyruvate/2-oxoglutarate dehydrogenase complex dihydrolipoamide acyltransferase (E2) component
VNVSETMRAISHCQHACRTTVSLHAYLIRCIALAAAEHPETITYRHRNSLIRFNSVDVGTALNKKQPDGSYMPMIYIVRNADQKSLAQINWEFRRAVRADLSRDPDVLARRRFARLPGFIRYLAMKRALNHPFGARRLYGNLQFTSLYQSGFHMPFVPFPPSLGTMSIAAGSVSETFLPDNQGQPKLSKVVYLGDAMNHDVIDGMPVVQFLQRRAALIEACTELDDAFIAETLKLNGAIIP